MHHIYNSRFATLIAMLAICIVFFSYAYVPVAQVKETMPNALGLLGPISASIPGSSDPVSDEWPMFRGALNHTGVATTTPVQGTGPAWTYTTGNYVESSAAVTNGRVYVGSDDGKVYCLNATTGIPIWSRIIGNFVSSSPAVAGGRVYVGSGNNGVYCLNATTGAQLWSYTSAGEIDYSSPAVTGGRVYVASSNYKIYCLNATTGTLLWFYTTNAPVTSSPAVVNGLVYVGSEYLNIYCLNATTGILVWLYTSSSVAESSPAIVSGRMYVGAVDGKVYCLNATTGAFIWNYTTANEVESSPAVAGGRVYVGSWDDKVYCLNATTGSRLWYYWTPGGHVDSSPAVAEGRVYVGSGNSNMYCLDACTGVMIWSYKTGGSIVSSPAIAGGHVFIGSIDNKVYCLPMILPPSAPRNLRTSNGNGQVLLAWQMPLGNGGSPITSYTIFRGTLTGGETLLATIGNMTTWTDTGVANGQVYYYKVSATSSAGEGPLSAEINATPSASTILPLAPLNLQALAGNGLVALSWQAPESNPDSPVLLYRIHRGICSGEETLIATIGNVTGWTDTGVMKGIPLYYEVSAVNGAGEGPRSNEVNITLVTIPGTPRQFVASFGNKQVTLAWQPPNRDGGAAISNYRLYRGTSAGGETLLVTLGNATTYVDTGLANTQAYYYEVVAINAAGEGNRTSEVRVSHRPPEARFSTTARTIYINTPMTFTDASQGGDSPVVAWSWSFGDNASATMQNATHAYAEPGIYTITLIVRDGNGLESNATMTITVVAITSRQGLMGITAGLVAALSAGVVITVKLRKKSIKRDWTDY